MQKTVSSLRPLGILRVNYVDVRINVGPNSELC